MVAGKSGANKWLRPAIQKLEDRRLLSTYLVANINDAGAGSLRQAILDSNAHSGPDVIQFTVGAGPVTISPLSTLPAITGPITLDGTSQPNYAGQPIVEINGASAGTGLVDGLTLTGGNSLVKGLVINGFSGSGIYGQDSGGDVYENNFIGTDMSGNSAVPNAIHGIILSGDKNRVGGPSPSQRNLISGNGGAPNGGAGIFLASSNSVIQGNYIGVNVSGATAIPNVTGIAAFGGATHNQIGGSAQDEGNLISGNSFAGMLLGSDYQTIQGNTIGLDLDASNVVPNGDGIITTDSSFQIIGGSTAASGNLISGNGRGVYMSGGGSNLVENNVITNNSESGVCIDAGIGDRIIANSIYGNRRLGIDLQRDGVTFNTPGGPHAGPNELQNFPVITSVRSDGFASTISGTLNSAPSSTFTLDFYDSPSASPSGFGEGKTYLGSTTVTTDSNGDVGFTAVLSDGPSFPGDVVAATAAAADGSTSEFSLDRFVEAAPPPAVVGSGFQYQQFPHQVTFSFDERVRDSISLDDLTIQNLATGAKYSPAGFHYDDSTNTAAFDLPRGLPDGNYRATLLAEGIYNGAFYSMERDATATFFELQGDANHDQKVNFGDLVAVAQHYGLSNGATWATGDFNGDGKVTFSDLVAVAQRYGTTLPALPSAAALLPIAAGAQELVPGASSPLDKQDQKSLFSTTAITKPAPARSKLATRAVVRRL